MQWLILVKGAGFSTTRFDVHRLEVIMVQDPVPVDIAPTASDGHAYSDV